MGNCLTQCKCSRRCTRICSRKCPRRLRLSVRARLPDQRVPTKTFRTTLRVLIRKLAMLMNLYTKVSSVDFHMSYFHIFCFLPIQAPFRAGAPQHSQYKAMGCHQQEASGNLPILNPGCGVHFVCFLRFCQFLFCTTPYSIPLFPQRSFLVLVIWLGVGGGGGGAQKEGIGKKEHLHSQGSVHCGFQTVV